MKGFTVFAYAVAVILMGPTAAESKFDHPSVSDFLKINNTIIDDQLKDTDTIRHELEELLQNVSETILEETTLSSEVTEPSEATTESTWLETSTPELLEVVNEIINEQLKAINSFRGDLYEDLKDFNQRIYEKAILSPAVTEKCMANNAEYCVAVADRGIKKIWERTEEKINICINRTLESANKHVADMETFLKEATNTRTDIRTLEAHCFTKDLHDQIECIKAHLTKYTDTKNHLRAKNTKMEELTASRRKQYVADYDKCFQKHNTYFTIETTNIHEEANKCLAAFIKMLEGPLPKESEPQPIKESPPNKSF